MGAIWDWIDGKKTTLGTLLLVVSELGLIGEHTIGYAWIEATLQYLGFTLTGVGLVHHGVKVNKRKKEADGNRL